MFYQLWFKHDFIEYKNNHGFTTVNHGLIVIFVVKLWFYCSIYSETVITAKLIIVLL